MLNIRGSFQKSNPNHDELGRFASGSGASLGFTGNADDNVKAMDYMDQIRPSHPGKMSSASQILVNRVASNAGGYVKHGVEPFGGAVFANSWRKSGQPLVRGYGVNKSRG